jgi:hypothetical protein
LNLLTSISISLATSDEDDDKNLKDLAKISHSKQFLINLYEELIEQDEQDELGLDLE